MDRFEVEVARKNLNILWRELINEGTVADMILDRLVHNAYRLEVKGESLRNAKASPAPQHFFGQRITRYRLRAQRSHLRLNCIRICYL